MKKRVSPALLVILYLALIAAYLWVHWKFEFQVYFADGALSLKNSNTLTASLQNGLLPQFLVLTGLRALGGALLALPRTLHAAYRAKCGGRAFSLRWSALTWLVLPLLVPSLGLAAQINSSAWFMFLMDGFTRDFCTIAIGYLLVPYVRIK